VTELVGFGGGGGGGVNVRADRQKEGFHALAAYTWISITVLLGEKVATPAGEGDLLPSDRHIDRPLPLGEVDPRGR
jgi:hypothetical protein